MVSVVYVTCACLMAWTVGGVTAQLAGPTLTISPSGNTRPGTELELTCSVDIRNGFPTGFRLYHEGTLEADELVTLSSWTFHTVSSVRQSGQYTCTAVHGVNETEHSNSVSLQVEVRAPQESTMLIENKGSGIIYVCDTPDVTPDYCTLYLNSSRFYEDRDCTFQSTLIPLGLSTLSCTATNSAGTSTSANELKMTRVAESAKIFPVDTTKEPKVGQPFSLICVPPRPNLLFEWFFITDSVTDVIATTQILEFDPLTSDHHGDYKCRAYLGTSISLFSEPYWLHFLPPAAPSLSCPCGWLPRKCTCESFDTSEVVGYSLYIDGHRVSSQRSRTFDIHVHRFSSSAVTCRAHNVFGHSSDSNVVHILGEDALTITTSPPRPELNQPFNLTCSSTVTSDFYWQITSPLGLRTVRTKTIELNSVQEHHAAVYECVIFYEEQIVAGLKRYTLTFSPPEPPIVVTGTVTGGLLRHSPAVLCGCNIDTCDSFNPFRLYKDGVPVQAPADVSEVSSISGSCYRINFHRLDTGDPSDYGTYTCTMRNAFGESKHSGAVVASSSGVGMINTTTPFVTSSNTDAVTGSDVILTCNSPSNPDAPVFWAKDAKLLLRTGRTLPLTNVQSEDSGIYDCFVLLDSGYESPTSYNPFVLDLTTPLQPHLYLNTNAPNARPRSLDVGVDQDIYLRCMSKFRGSADTDLANDVITEGVYTLYRDGVEFLTGDQHGVFTVPGAGLIGQHEFTCAVSNRFGTSPRSAVLPIRYVESHVLTFEGSRTPQLGSNVSFTCQGQVLGWLKNGKPLVESTSTLRLVNLTKIDEGHYFCRSWEGADDVISDSQTYTLLIGDRPATPDLFTYQRTSLLTGEFLDLHCLSDSSTSTKAHFFRDGVRIGTQTEYNRDDGGKILFAHAIESVGSDDLGLYTCTVWNEQGESLQSQPLVISVDGVSPTSSTTAASTTSATTTQPTTTPTTKPTSTTATTTPMSTDSPADEDVCPAGSYKSVSGVCSPCPAGSYQNQAGQSECIHCGGNAWENRSGATDVSACLAGAAGVLENNEVNLTMTVSTPNEEVEEQKLGIAAEKAVRAKVKNVKSYVGVKVTIVEKPTKAHKRKEKRETEAFVTKAVIRLQVILGEATTPDIEAHILDKASTINSVTVGGEHYPVEAVELYAGEGDDSNNDDGNSDDGNNDDDNNDDGNNNDNNTGDDDDDDFPVVPVAAGLAGLLLLVIVVVVVGICLKKRQRKPEVKSTTREAGGYDNLHYDHRTGQVTRAPEAEYQDLGAVNNKDNERIIPRDNLAYDNGAYFNAAYNPSAPGMPAPQKAY